MKLIKPSIKFLDSNQKGVFLIEEAGRTCYQSHISGSTGSASKFVKMLLDRGHHAMIEFGWLCYKVICDRGVTHEIVRHRLFSYAQESTRYCNYKGGVTFILPPWIEMPVKLLKTEVFFDANEEGLLTPLGPTQPARRKSIEYRGAAFLWLRAIQRAEEAYKALLNQEWTPQQARSVLPNSLKTEIVMAANIREWQHFFKLRCSPKAHPQMQEIANMLLEDARKRFPVVFDEVTK